MDITDEQAKLSKSSSTPSQQHTLIGSSDHVIPQMVITSADDISEEPKNVSECTLVLFPPSNGHSTDDKNASAEFTELANSVPEEKPVVDFEDISVVVRDVVSRCTESVSHSVRQRPLVMEVEKNVQQQESARDDISIKYPPPPPPPPVPPNVTPPPPSIGTGTISSPTVSSPPTTMQRPLVFEGVTNKPELSPEIQKETTISGSSKIKDEQLCDRRNLEIQLISEVPSETVKSPEECTTPTKKEGLQGVKKFFDSLWHPESHDSAISSEELVTQRESDIPSEIPQSGKSNVKKIFNSPQSDLTKLELSQSLELHSENKDSTSFAKEAKQSIKAFFDTFKHDSVESKESSETKGKVDLPTAKEADGEKILHSSTPESPKEPKQFTSFAKDTKQNIKSFFKHEISEHKLKSGYDKKSVSQPDIVQEGDSDKNLQSFVLDSPKESTSFAKDTKQSIKAFFKHETSEHKLKSGYDKKSVSQPDIVQEGDSNKIRQSFVLESPKESTSFAKDTKQNIKAFFKHDTSEHKLKSGSDKKSVSQPDVGQEGDSNKNLQSFALESPKESKESTSFAKDTKQSIKSFFDTFKHEPGEQKSKTSVSTKSVSQPVIDSEGEDKNIHSFEPESPKESTSFAKDTKQNIKAFFETFKHEPSEQKSKSSGIKISISQPNFGPEVDTERNLQTPSPESPKEIKEPSSFVKDTKHNIKAFFDTFKHEPDDQKQKDNACKKSFSQPDFTKESKEIEAPLHETPEISKGKDPTSFAKGAKQNVKSFFDTFKAESSASKHEDVQRKPGDLQPNSNKETNQSLEQDGESTKLNEVTKESTSFAKDTRQNIKAFFDTFKHESCDLKNKETSSKTTVSEPNLDKEQDSAPIPKDTKHPIKKLFSFKHVEAGETVSSEFPDNSTINLPTESKKDKLPKVTKSVKLDLNPQYSSNGVKNNEKVSGSFSHINGQNTELVSAIKERAQSVPSDRERKKINILPEVKKTEVSSVASLDSPDVKSAEHKGFKKFFDSFKHERSDVEKGSSCSVDSKKIIAKDINSLDLAAENESRSAEKPAKDKKGKSIKRSLSDKVSREEVVQNFKGFFDSISHRSSSKKSVRDSEHIYDVVEVKHETDNSVPVIQISAEETETTKGITTKSETQGMKKILSSFRSKDSSKSDSENICVAPIKSSVAEVINKESKSQKSPHPITDLSPSTSGNINNTAANDLLPKEADLEIPKSDKSSVFNSIGENIMALKEKMLPTKEKRKSDIFDDSAKISGTSAKTDEISKEKDQKIAIAVVTDQLNKENIIKAKPIPSEKPTKNKELSKIYTPPVSNVDVTENPDSGPNSLYDTCCIKIAVLLRDKALDIVADRTKSPPPKPPKPSAEAIARARAAAVSRRLEAQRLGHSIGENIPVGCDGIRFADDETESSCDYKDVENFDYIMDYDLINRYKLDSSKFDTFSVPSTCSGLTSYYTADTVTLRDDIYSDAVMETVSLSSDISYNFKHLPTTSKSEPKISSAVHKEVKDKVDSVSSKEKSSKQSTPKKIPPPIPPKPLILQNISKVKGKSDDKTISQCVNGLSLSPRLQNKFSKDPAATQKRPLMVADIKGTQFSSLQHPKSRKVPPKPTRNFDAILKNESLKNISCITPAIASSTVETSTCKSSSSKVSIIKNVSEDPSLESSIEIEKRTKSPARPPPPNLSKKPEKPPKPERPPPPVKSSKITIPDEMSEEISEKLEYIAIKEELTNVTNLTEEKEPDSDFQTFSAENIVKGDQYTNLPEISQLSAKDVTHESSIAIHSTEPIIIGNITDDSSNLDLNNQKDDLNNNFATENDIADCLNNNIQINKSTSVENPKPPPRNRRVRSRTVEVVPTERCEERLKRSQSLSEIDVQKRVTFLNAEKSLADSQSLYTLVNKDGRKSNNEKTSQSSPDLVSYRPLPAPPPPPRKFRSLERKGKSKKVYEEKEGEKNINTGEVIKSSVPSGNTIRPPSRRRKSEKQRFFSLHSNQQIEIDESLKRASSVPSKPDRKIKSSVIERYDVNANISCLQTSQEDLNLSNQNIPNIDNTDSLNQSKSKRDTDSRERSHSSWYDGSEILDQSWEMVDEIPSQDLTDELKHNPIVPLRHRSESKRKSRETSKFYVNMTEEPNVSAIDKSASPLPLVDKETSPLPLSCSEKSVQTSLETLSHGKVSRDDDQSEDTDELLDLAQTLQKELSTIINRHKSVNESTEETPSPPLSAANSERNLLEIKELKKISSVRSSTSEVWPVTSSDESDVERVGEDSSNINEVAVKRKQKKIFYIAREIMTSEEAFVDALKLLNVDFKAAVEDASKQKNMCIIPDDVLSQILNHLPQLQHLNENLLMELKDRIENWDKHEKIADIIVKMGPFLKLYSWYIHDFEANVSLLEDSKKKYPAFAQVIKEFEMSARCKRLALNHYMLKPIQRIPQYRLLLQEYLHHLIEDSKDYQDTVSALQIVSEVANHANDSMKHGDNAQKLISIQNSIMGHKEIVKPGRVFVKEGELMKLSRKGMQPRWFVLFNDLLLYLTPVQQGLYRVNHELPLTGMKVAIPIQQDYQNEFSIISVTRSFTLAARSQEERQEWIIALTKAIEENASKRSTFTNSRLHQKAQDKTSSEDEGAFVLGKKAPVWIPDARVTMCQLCTSEFTVTFRRHHCRACGKVVCSICSSHRISLPYLGNRIARVCDECHQHLGQGSSACTETGETDSDNQQIAVKPHLRTDNRHVKKNKRMLPSVLKEVCANDQGSTISGYLHKKTGKSWKRDWFVVKDKVLYEYKASEDVAALRSIPLLGYQIESFNEAYEGVDASLLFQLTHPGQAPIIFYADTVGSSERWVSALKTATVLE